MKRLIGIRREDINKWEKRVPLTPEDVKRLIEEEKIDVIVQPSSIRIFTDAEYEAVGAKIQEDLSECPIVFAVKEIPINCFLEGKTYVFFSHVIKGQPHNMPMLKKMMELKCNLIDYEKITDDKGYRLIFFGRYAGLAGMAVTLFSLGQRLKALNIPNPFEELRHTYTYKDLEHIKESVKDIGTKIKNNGIPRELAPLIVGITGYGHVSQGAQEILDLLPTIEIKPSEIREIYETRKEDTNHIYKVVFYEKDMVKPNSDDYQFELQDYYNYPEKYHSVMEEYLPYLTVLLNCIYWTDKYPRVITKDFAKKLYSENDSPTLKVIGDISCDLNGGVEFTEQETEPDNPCFLYNPLTDESKLGFEGKGIAVMSIYNLPCEVPKESSSAFSNVLEEFVPSIVEADYTGKIEDCHLPMPIKRAMILYHGELTEGYKYLEKYVK